MFNDFFASFQPLDWLALGIGVALGVIVVFALRARQVWVHRRSYGYDIYTADRLRRRFAGWVVMATLIGVVAIVLFVFRTYPASAPVPTGPKESMVDERVLEGMKLIIPRLGVETTVINARIIGHDWDISQLTGEVAHLEGTAFPGQPGNAALAGHVTIPGSGWGPFRELETLQIGDEVAIRMADNQVFTYHVSQVSLVDPTTVQVALPTPDTRLTLMTCTGWDEGVDRYLQRVVVVAELVD
jgi:LPXTG-site transpeptidase (sortase) family protein